MESGNSMNHQTLFIIPYASGIASSQPDSELGPAAIQQALSLQNLSVPFQWHSPIKPHEKSSQLSALHTVGEMNEQLAELTYRHTLAQQPFLVIGGDHSCAIGTWSGASTAVSKQGPLGLLWIDAHMDSHTPTSSPSKNIHGMPLAALLGYGNGLLTHIQSPYPKLLPPNIVLVGIRSYEPEEAELLKQLQVRIFYMDEVKQRGIAAVMQEALAIVTQNTSAFGISIDIDGIDPHDAPAVATTEKDGIPATAFLETLPMIAKHEKFIGAEIAEYNPPLDRENKTQRLIIEMIQQLFYE